MSSSPTAPTSTTASLTSSPSEIVRYEKHHPGGKIGASRSGLSRVGLIACGALAQPAGEIVARRGWALDVHPLPPLLHNHPQAIAGAVREVAERYRESYSRLVVGYADCGTYGALDRLCAELDIERLPGLHCYDLYAGSERIRRIFEEQPGTYVFTDFLVRSFHRTIISQLGLDRWPELREDYFKGYTRVVWLSQRPTADLRALASEAAVRLGLPLTEIRTGSSGLEAALERALAGT
jgi:hypothetical protein